jgi:hypothetical protein
MVIKLREFLMQANSFDVVQERKRITMFKLRGHFVFRHYFDDKEIFRELADHYDRNHYRFEFKTPAERNKALKLLERRGFDVDLVEDTKGYVVKLSRYSKYAPVLKNSVAHIETPEWRIFLMKDLAAVAQALRQGAKLVEVDVKF